MIPGEIIPAGAEIPLNPGRERTRIIVANPADRPVQIGSHYHFAAANPSLEFDRQAAWGKRLDIPAGAAVRFEPGVEREVDLVPMAGHCRIHGLRLEWAGDLDQRGAQPDELVYGGKGEGHP